jgi:hypothetical protein
MASIDDEKLVLHVRDHLVVHNLLDEALLNLGGQSLDCGCPGFRVKRRSVEGIQEEVGIFSRHRHQLWRKAEKSVVVTSMSRWF